MADLHEASRVGDATRVQALLAETAPGSNEPKYDVNKGDWEGQRALHHASRNGHTPVVQLLVDHKASLNIQNRGGWTALHHACDNGHTSTVQFLADHGASLSVQTKLGWTALHVASRNGHSSAVRSLVDHGASLNVQTPYGRTALHLASSNGRLSAVQSLADGGACLDVQDKDGSTALHLAAYKGHSLVVQCLAEYGASLDVQSKDGRTAADVAATDEIRQLLHQAGTERSEAEARRVAVQSLLPVSAVWTAQERLKEAQTSVRKARNGLEETERQLQVTEERHVAARGQADEFSRQIAEVERERTYLCDRLRELDERLGYLCASREEKDVACTELEQLIRHQNEGCSARREVLGGAERILLEAQNTLSEHEKTLAAWQERATIPSSLDVSDVCVFLDAIGLASHAPSFREQGITGTLLLRVRESDLQHDLGMDRLVDRLRLAFHVRRLDAGQLPPLPPFLLLHSSPRMVSPEPHDILSWDSDRVVLWLNENGLSAYASAFRREGITGDAVVMLGAEHLRDVLGVSKLGDRDTLQGAVASLYLSVFGMDESECDRVHAASRREAALGAELNRLRAETESLRRRVTDAIPDDFLCPITHCIMTDPVVCMDGHTYERVAIERWFYDHGTSPMTGQLLPSTLILPNHALRKAIRGFLERHNGEDGSP